MRAGSILGAVVGAVLATGAWSGTVAAQVAQVDSTPYVRARDMVSNGEVEQGRAAIDSLLKAATPGTPAYAEGLYWRAAIAQTARDAERDYRQVVVDYPLSPRVPDALIRLGQLESARGDRVAALQHFQRVVIEYPTSRRRAEASYWVANTYLSRNDLQHGCAANADALARVDSTNVELKNRIDYQQLRCRNVQLATTPAPAPVEPAPAPRTAETARAAEKSEKSEKVEKSAKSAKSESREVPVTESRATAEATKAQPTKAEAKPESTATTHTTTHTATRTTTRTTAEAHGASTATKSSRGNSSSSSRSTAVSTTTSTARPSMSGGYAVQVAAYSSRAQANALAAKLRARGYPSHVDGQAAPYRVRIGHYHTRADAVAVLKRLKAKKIDGFVAEF